MTLRPAIICIAALLISSLAVASDDPVADYLATRERLVPAAVSSHIALQQVLATGDFDHVEVTGDVSGKCSAAPALEGHPMRTLMLTLDDGWSLALKAGEEIDALQVGHRVAVIARPSGGSGLNDLLLEAWAYDWDLPHEEEGAQAPPVEAPSALPAQPDLPVVSAPAGAPPTVGAAPIVPPSPDAGLDGVIAVWRKWVLGLNPKLSDEQASNIVRWVLHYSQQYNVNHKLIFALIKWESWYNPGCVSHAGATGLMQLMPGTVRSLGVDPRNVQQNIEGGVHYLSEQLEIYRNRPNYERVLLALACYNAGPNAVKRAGNCVPNITETRSYVRKVSGTFYELHQAGMP